MKNQSGKVTLEDLPSVLVKVKSLSSSFKEKEIKEILGGLGSDYESDDDLDFESFLKVSLIFLCVVLCFVCSCESLLMNVMCNVCRYI